MGDYTVNLMPAERTIEKTLPRTGREIEIEVESSGSDAEVVKVEVLVPIPFSYSEPTKQKYSGEHIGSQQYWVDGLNNRIDSYEVQSHTSTSRSGNMTLHGCYVEFNYYEDSDIQRTTKQLLLGLDDLIMAEKNRNDALEESTEAAQQKVCSDIAESIEQIEL